MKSCGQCQACCVAMGVDGLKPARQRCVHQCEKGCAVYATRPAPCAGYECLWLQLPDWPRDWRPDRLGLIFDQVAEGPAHDALEVASDGRWLIAREVRPNAATQPDGALAIASLSVLGLVQVVRFSGGPGLLHGPRHMVEQAKRLEEVSR